MLGAIGAINNSLVKYRHPIPILNDSLNELYMDLMCLVRLT